MVRMTEIDTPSAIDECDAVTEHQSREQIRGAFSMLYLAIKAALSGIIIATVSEVARRSPTLGALIVSLPLVSLLGILWLWHDTGDAQRIATHVQSTFWYVLPPLPMFLPMPAMLRPGTGGWIALAACCALTFVLYLVTVWVLGKFGVAL